MKINWNKRTRFSGILAIILYVGTFAFAFYFGEQYGKAKAILLQFPITNNEIQEDSSDSINATFVCDEGKEIDVLFFEDKAQISLSDGRNFTLLRGISASGARYVNEAETFVFWNKGDTAFIQENDVNTYDNCLVKI